MARCIRQDILEMIGYKKVGHFGGSLSIADILAVLYFYKMRHDPARPKVHYHVAKAGVVMMTKALAAEWAKYNIRVNAILPGYMRTRAVDKLLPKSEKEWTSLTPMGRIGEAFEIKGPALFLASRASSFVTGCMLVMDGGYTIW